MAAAEWLHGQGASHGCEGRRHLQKVSVGTELNVVQEGIPEVIPQEACYLGWQQSLENLAKRVEPAGDP